MKIAAWLFLMSVGCLWAQEGAPQTTEESAPAPAQTERSEENEAQRSTREISLRALQEADTMLDRERETLTKQERRINLLLEDMENQSQALQTKEDTLQNLVAQLQDNQQEAEIPLEQIAHWESRDPVVASKDFIVLYEESPAVAVALVKKMKKKKGASLIDQVSQLSDRGKKIAAELHEAIGTGRLPEQ